MTPVTPYLRHYALALLSGAGVATAAVNLVPGYYHDLIEWRPLEILPNWLFAPVPDLATVFSTLFMPFFILLIGKEIWEAIILKKGAMHGRHVIAPAILALGSMAGAVLIWQIFTFIFQTAEEAGTTPEWAFPLGGDVVLAYFFGRLIFGRGHPALQLLLFVTIFIDLAALLIAGLAAPVLSFVNPLRLLWLALPLAAALTGYHLLTAPALRVEATEVQHQRANRLHNWAGLAVISWLGVTAAGLPAALGFLPLLPAMPHAHRSFGLFAVAERFLTDPLNRLEHWLLAPLVSGMTIYGFTRGGFDFAAFGEPTLVITLAAFWIGKPLGAMVAVSACRARGLKLQLVPGRRDMVIIAGLLGMGFTVPALSMVGALPGGAMQEAARLGMGISILIGPVLLLLVRKGRIYRTN
ncbi:MAG: hypothetical protein ACK5M4_07060 [Pseudorhodobacter sp.]